MCMILDSNRWVDFLNQKEDMKPIHKWLEKQNGKLVYSNYEPIQRELNRLTNNNLKVYYEAGKALFIPSEEVKKKVEDIKKYQLKSNDIHILGLAKAANAKVLCTKDKKLHQDFKSIIKGRIYQNKGHQHLLTPDTCL